MKIQFDANQPFQLEAVAAVTELFDGQPEGPPEYVVIKLGDSAIERGFAGALDDREDIKLFVKLPAWFEIETTLGKYNPDWAILKHDGTALYLVRETKGTRDSLKLRFAEADKVRCGAVGRATSRRSVSRSRSLSMRTRSEAA